MLFKNLSSIFFILYGMTMIGGNQLALESLQKEAQAKILEEAIAKFIKNTMPANLKSPRFLVSPQSKNFIYNEQFDIVCVPLDQATKNLAALEFLLLHEFAHAQQQEAMSCKEEELYADYFAACFTTRTKFCNSFIELMKKIENEENTKGYEIDPQYPTTEERIANINAALAEHSHLKEKFKPKTLLSFIQEFIEKV